MTNTEAHTLLNAAKAGQDIPEEQITEALVATGDRPTRGKTPERRALICSILQEQPMASIDIQEMTGLTRRSVEVVINWLRETRHPLASRVLSAVGRNLKTCTAAMSPEARQKAVETRRRQYEATRHQRILNAALKSRTPLERVWH